MANQFKSPVSGEFFDSHLFFFKNHPVVEYDLDNTGQTIAIRNFLRKFTFRNEIKDNISSFSTWTIRDEDTPEVIAHKLYDSPYLYWIVMMLNNILDPMFQWPMTDKELYGYCDKIYGASGIYAHHHFEAEKPVEIEDLPEGTIVDERYHRKTSISNYDYESYLNEKRRKIKLLKPEYLADVLNEWDSIKDSEFSGVTR